MAKSCDTFVVLPPHTGPAGGVIFGKNSDRPHGEVQEVVLVPATGTTSGRLTCTYIDVDVLPPAAAPRHVILSKPGWMWGAEMGANDCGVVIGNEAIWSHDNTQDPAVKRLLGMDLLRLGLVFGTTAESAMDVIITYLERYGQGGPCSVTDSGLCYHNSYLIADPQIAWVLETVGKHWVAKKITEGHYNISNSLTITTPDKMSNGLVEYAKESGFWNGEGEFNFAAAFGEDKGCERHTNGQQLLNKYTANNAFCEKDMFSVLRDKESGICRSTAEGFPTQGSQVSTLYANSPCTHWFTATPDPSLSVFKPFIFTPNAKVSVHTKCSDDKPQEGHRLYALHEKTNSDSKSNHVLDLLRNMEDDCVKELHDLLDQIKTSPEKSNELDELMKDCVETEVKFYR